MRQAAVLDGKAGRLKSFTPVAPPFITADEDAMAASFRKSPHPVKKNKYRLR